MTLGKRSIVRRHFASQVCCAHRGQPSVAHPRHNDCAMDVVKAAAIVRAPMGRFADTKAVHQIAISRHRMPAHDGFAFIDRAQT